MSEPADAWDFAVIGAGPAGQKAAVQAAKAGKRVLVVDREPHAGGECVHRGTIPSKTLRHSALFLAQVRAHAEPGVRSALPAGTAMRALMRRLDQVQHSHETYMERQIERNRIERVQGVARFTSPAEIEIEQPGGATRRVRAERFVIASGSRPRRPSEIPIDHERVLDSDSILSLVYLPASLTVLGGGVIACEFASIFQALGVRVELVDRGARPLAFLDPELSERFARTFQGAGGVLHAGRRTVAVEVDALGHVTTRLDDGRAVRSELLLCALGREASVRGLGLDAAGIALDARGQIPVDRNLRTLVPHIYAAGDCIGPPALATTSMEQGRRAALHALGLPLPSGLETVPVGIYTIPEIATVGLDAAQAEKELGAAPLVGRARFDELARGQIGGDTDGFLKLVADAEGRRVLGAQVFGDGACELVHVAQMAILAGLEVDALVESIFNFPTLAEGYRVAALDVAGQRERLRRRAA